MGTGADSEFGLIERLFAPLSDTAHGLDLIDDVGLLPEVQGRQCVTSDMIVAGVHFLPDDPPDLIARKLIRVNVSDLAAKGATPSACTLSAAFNTARDVSWIEEFTAGLAEDLRAYDLSLVGGDTVRTPGPDSFSLTATGSVPKTGLVLRAGAQPGDNLYVTGTIGDAGLGLMILQGELGTVALGRRTPLVGRYHLPQPRLGFGHSLPRFASAALDVSDGLVADAGHLARCSDVALEIEAERVPLSTSAGRMIKGRDDLKVRLLGAGDDYEILFTAPPDAADAIADAAGASDTPVTRIGAVGAGEAGTVTVVDGKGTSIGIPNKGYRHF